MLGCSDNSSKVSSSQQNKKTPDKQKAQVVELLVNNPSGQGATKKPAGGGSFPQKEIEAAIRASKQPADPDTIEVIPPRKPGERGLTQKQVDALKPAATADPDAIEVIPPRKPGEHGLTQKQVDALKPAAATDPDAIEVIPPRKPGERGLTQRQVDALRPAPAGIDPQSKIIPPNKPGASPGKN